MRGKCPSCLGMRQVRLDGKLAKHRFYWTHPSGYLDWKVCEGSWEKPVPDTHEPPPGRHRKDVSWS